MFRDGKNGIYNSDLIYINNDPYIVTEWIDNHEGNGDTPKEKVKIDKAFLSDVQPNGEYIYELPLSDPKQLS